MDRLFRSWFKNINFLKFQAISFIKIFNIYFQNFKYPYYSPQIDSNFKCNHLYSLKENFLAIVI